MSKIKEDSTLFSEEKPSANKLNDQLLPGQHFTEISNMDLQQTGFPRAV